MLLEWICPEGVKETSGSKEAINASGFCLGRERISKWVCDVIDLKEFKWI